MKFQRFLLIVILMLNVVAAMAQSNEDILVKNGFYTEVGYGMDFQRLTEVDNNRIKSNAVVSISFGNKLYTDESSSKKRMGVDLNYFELTSSLDRINFIDKVSVLRPGIVYSEHLRDRRSIHFSMNAGFMAHFSNWDGSSFIGGGFGISPSFYFKNKAFIFGINGDHSLTTGRLRLNVSSYPYEESETDVRSASHAITFLIGFQL